MSVPSGSSGEVAAIGRPGDRWVLLIGAAVLIMLGVLSWTYYLERMACADSAFFSWLMIDGERPMSVLGRYGSWIPQLLPVLLIRAGASLEAVLRTYSISFILFHALVFWLAAIRLKDGRAAFVLPIALTAAFHYMFYYGISELYQGLSLSILLWVIISRTVGMDERRSFLRWSLLALLLNVWISFYHQLLVLPLLFILVYEALATKGRSRKRWVILGGVMVLWYVVRIKTMATTTYEESRMPTVHDLLEFGRHWRWLESTTYLSVVWTKFHGLLVLIMAGLIIGLVQRAWLRTLWTLMFSMGFLLLALIVDREGKAVLIYENYYPVLGLAWAMHLVSVLPSQGSIGRLRPVLMLVVCALGLMQIHRAHYLVSEKVAYSQRITAFWEAQGRQKLLVRSGNYPWVAGMGIWPLGMETGLASSIKGPSYTSTVFVSEDLALLDTIAPRTEQFLGPLWQPVWFKIPDLDRRYFELPTDTGYTWANTCDSFDLNKLVLRGPSIPFRMRPDRFTVVPIIIHNPTTEIMHSCTADGTPVRMSYRLFHKDGTEYLRGTEISALETDIPPGMSYHQGLVIERPKDKGVYWVLADLLIRDQPFGKYVTFDMVVDGSPF